MANIKSSAKRAKQSKARNLINSAKKASVRTIIKNARNAISEKNEDAADLLKEAISAVQKAGNKGLYHKNTASRTISRLQKFSKSQ